MYNHDKAQQSKNRVHISWDMLYKPKRKCVLEMNTLITNLSTVEKYWWLLIRWNGLQTSRVYPFILIKCLTDAYIHQKVGPPQIQWDFRFSRWKRRRLEIDIEKYASDYILSEHSACQGTGIDWATNHSLGLSWPGLHTHDEQLM